MRKVKYIGNGYIYLTNGKVYDVYEYVDSPNINYQYVMIKDDNGDYNIFYLYFNGRKYIEDATAEYRNILIEEILI